MERIIIWHNITKRETRPGCSGHKKQRCSRNTSTRYLEMYAVKGILLDFTLYDISKIM
ncbi:MAG: hypothetical protein IJR62_04135 [Lachnospiraceae bacterium]|nr:hypothetical protein [Lachnospiraceae bacterium]